MAAFSLSAALLISATHDTMAARRKTKSKVVKRKKTEAKPHVETSLAAGWEAFSKNDAATAIAAWRPLFQSSPSENSTRGLWPLFVQLCIENDRLAVLESAANELDSPQSSPELRAAARLVERRAAWREKRLKEAQDLTEKLNFLQNWQVVGPFENQSETGLDEIQAPEREDTLRKTPKGENDKPLRWQPLPTSREGLNWVSRFLGDGKPGVYYAATAINSPSARTVQLRFNHSGAAKMWLNGKLVFLDPTSRPSQNVDPDVFVVTQKLEAGWNSILLKIADDSLGETMFSLRLTNDKGANLPLLQTDSMRFKWQNISGQTTPALPNLLNNFGTPVKAEDRQIFAWAQRFFGESGPALPILPLLSPQQLSLKQKATKLEQQGKIKGAISAYNEFLKTEDFSPEILQRLISLQVAQSDVVVALSTWKKLRAYRPQDAELVALYADFLLQQGDKNGALAAYQQAIVTEPLRTVWREKIRVLSGEKTLLDSIPDVKISVDKPPAQVDSPPEKSDVTLLLDEARQIVYDDRAILTRFHQIIRINSSNGARQYENFVLPEPAPDALLTIESAKVISAGKSNDVLRNSNDNSLKIPTLIAGDVVDLTYRVEENQHGFWERQFWSQWFFNLAGVPVQTSRFILITPPSVTFNIRSHGDVPAPIRSQLKSGNATWEAREWRMDNVAARPIETLSVAPQDANLWIDISSVVSWKSVADWYRDASAPRRLISPSVRAKAQQLTQSANSNEDKLRALHSFVSHSLRTERTKPQNYSVVPQSASQTLRRGYGTEAEKANLLLAFCESIGIKARLALFNSRSEGLGPLLPSPRLQGVMVVAQIEGKDVWLDVNYPEFDSLPSENQGVPVLPIEDGSMALSETPIAAAESNIAATKYELNLEPSGQMKGTCETSFSGEWGSDLRSRWNGLAANRRAGFATGAMQNLMPTAKAIKDISYNFSSVNQPLKIQFSLETKQLSAAENEVIMQLPWQRLMSVSKVLLDASTQRTQEYEVAALRGLSLDTLKLKLPPGMMPQNLQDEIKDSSTFGRYRFTYKMEGETSVGATLIVTREVLVSPLRVSVDDSAGYVAFCKAIVRESEREIILKKQP